MHCTNNCPAGTFTSGSQCLDCAANCETCISSAVLACITCATGYFADPSSNVCGATCPAGYYPNTSGNTCSQCNQACATCTGPNFTECSSCASQYFSMIGNPSVCWPCSSACDECSGAGYSSCTNCDSGAGYLPVESTSLTCVKPCT